LEEQNHNGPVEVIGFEKEETVNLPDQRYRC